MIKKPSDNDLFFTATPNGFDDTTRRRMQATLRDLDLPRQGLILTETGEIRDGNDSIAGQTGTFVTTQRLADLFTETFGEPLTPAELRLLVDLLQGKSLRDSGAAHGLAYETCRNQLKAILAKSQTGRQVDLLMRLTNRLVQEVVRDQHSDLAFCAPLRSILARFTELDSRVSVFRASTGERMLIADLGPLDGRPCVMLHSAYFTLVPPLSAQRILKARGIRVITPFRPGYFGASIKGMRGEVGLHAHVQALSEFLYVFGLAQAPIAAHASGALHLVHLLATGARLAGPLILSSPTYLPDGDFERVSRHFRVAVTMARSRPKLAHALFSLALSTLRASSHWQNAFAQYMGWSSDDMARHETMLSQRAAFALNTEMFRLNLPGFVNDIGLTATGWPALDRSATVPTLLFGEQETVTDFDQIRHHPGLEAARIEILPDAGRSAALLDPGLLFDLMFPETVAPGNA